MKHCFTLDYGSQWEKLPENYWAGIAFPAFFKLPVCRLVAATCLTNEKPCLNKSTSLWNRLAEILLELTWQLFLRTHWTPMFLRISYLKMKISINFPLSYKCNDFVLFPWSSTESAGVAFQEFYMAIWSVLCLHMQSELDECLLTKCSWKNKTRKTRTDPVNKSPPIQPYKCRDTGKKNTRIYLDMEFKKKKTELRHTERKCLQAGTWSDAIWTITDNFHWSESKIQVKSHVASCSYSKEKLLTQVEIFSHGET